MPKPKSRKKKQTSSSLILPISKISSDTKNKLRILTGLILILLSAVILNLYLNIRFPKQSFNFTETSQNNNVVQTGSIEINPALMKEQNAFEEPIRIVMPTANIDLNVVEAPVKDGFWETSNTTASHGMGSADPGESGNSVIFAHARVGLFYNLKNLNKGDIVYVFTSKRWFAYEVTDIKSVYPNQVEVIGPSSDQRLTLYTCTGYADNQRLIVTAKPVKQS